MSYLLPEGLFLKLCQKRNNSSIISSCVCWPVSMKNTLRNFSTFWKLQSFPSITKIESAKDRVGVTVFVVFEGPVGELGCVSDEAEIVVALRFRGGFIDGV